MWKAQLVLAIIILTLMYFLHSPLITLDLATYDVLNMVTSSLGFCFVLQFGCIHKRCRSLCDMESQGLKLPWFVLPPINWVILNKLSLWALFSSWIKWAYWVTISVSWGYWSDEIMHVKYLAQCLTVNSSHWWCFCCCYCYNNFLKRKKLLWKR